MEVKRREGTASIGVVRDVSFMGHVHRWAGSMFLCLPPMADVDWVAEAGWLLSQVPRPSQEGCPSDPKL